MRRLWRGQTRYPEISQRAPVVNAWVGRGVQDGLALVEIGQRYLDKAVTEQKDLPCSKEVDRILGLNGR